MRKVFLSGGTGFIGQNLVSFLLKNGVEIVNFANQTRQASNANRNIVKGDICDSLSVENAMDGCDVVINLAAESSASKSMTDSRNFMRTNVTGASVLLESARKLGVKKFFQMGTDQVYGNCEKGGFSENAALNPTNPYSASKAAADLIALSYFRTYDFPVVIARSSIVFGPCQHPEKLLPVFITNAIRKKPLPVYNNGLYRRQWIFVADICEAIVTLLEKGKPGEVYNTGGTEKTNLEVAKSVLKILGKSVSLISHVKDDKFYDMRYAVDTAKIGRLGWKPRFSFEDALSNTVEWYKNNESWWAKFIEKSQGIKPRTSVRLFNSKKCLRIS